MYHLVPAVRLRTRARFHPHQYYQRLRAHALASCVLAIALQPALAGRSPAAFTHPGALVTAQELDFAKTMVAAGQQPWTGAL
jgi:hypothetical protein